MLRTSLGIKPESFTELGISRRMIFRYEKGEVNPTLEKVITLANFYGVSLDYLTGRSDDPRREEFSYRREEVLQKIENNSQSEK